MGRFAFMAAFVLSTATLGAQDHQHRPGMQHPAAGSQPKEGGQAAFTSIAEIVKLLDADPRTDWSKVNLEALRQHLIGVVALGDHHAPHHLGIANGTMTAMHGHDH